VTDVTETRRSAPTVTGMARRLRSIARALSANLNPAERGVHFHGGLQGAYVCDDPRCTSPALDPRDA
jgi:hypothetical protein